MLEYCRRICEDALCREVICNEDYKLSGTRLGRTNDECCVLKPLIPSVSGDVTSGIDVDCEDVIHQNLVSISGSTKDECCTSKSCFDNDFGDIVVDGDGGDGGDGGGGGGGGGCANENMEQRKFRYTSRIYKRGMLSTSFM